MTSSGATESLEVERKYEVLAGAMLPGAGEFAGLGISATSPVKTLLVARYFDSPSRALAQQQIAVRRREGGKDAGWHLKERLSEGVREVAWPPSEEMPEGLRSELRARLGGATRELVPVSTMRTSRTVVQLCEAGAGAPGGEAVSGAASAGDDGEDPDTRELVALVELVDDSVLATDHLGGVSRAWREWETELMPGATRKDLDRVEPILLAAGAAPSLSVAKNARAAGRLVELAISDGAEAGVLAALAITDLADRLAAEAAPPIVRVEELRRLAQSMLC